MIFNFSTEILALSSLSVLHARESMQLISLTPNRGVSAKFVALGGPLVIRPPPKPSW